MKIYLALFLLCLPSHFALASEKETTEITQKIVNEILVHGHAYSDLTELTKIGGRLCGSANAAKAVEWGKQKMESYGFDKVWLQPVKVPRWERGNIERATAIIGKKREKLRIAALGGSIGTGKKGVTASVVEVRSLDEVNALGEKVKGKIVFYNRPMDPSKVDTHEAYGGASDQRFSGPALAAKYGAVAALVRSMTLQLDDHPHVGRTKFEDGTGKIPCAAVSTNDSEKLSALLKTAPDLKIDLELSAKSLGETESFNVIGELTGREKPNEFIVVGGHLDSWDLAQGAQDDGAGVVQSIEVLRAIHSLGLHPKRTIRAVLFMAEEVGAFGGKEYAKQAKEKGEKHIAALESDCGGFTPLGFSVHEKPSAIAQLRTWGKYFAPIHSDLVREGDAGTDTVALGELGTTLIGFVPDSQRYFDYHHAETDKIEVVNARELHLGASAMAILIWLLADQGI